MLIDISMMGVTPVPAPRPRVTKYGTYNDSGYTAYKNLIARVARSKRERILEGMIKLEIEFIYTTPKNWSKTKKANATYKTSKPDIDNLTKGAMDALNNIAYKDDAIVVELVARKLYGDKAGVIIKIEELKNV